MALPQRFKRYLARKAPNQKFSSKSATGHSLASKPKQSTKYSKGYLPYQKRKRAEERKRQRALKRLSLLKLPAEARNKIWEYALTENATVEISPICSRQPPEWVSACKQMRGETWKMWYRVNQFNITIYNLDARAYHRWLRYLMSRNVAIPALTLTIHHSCNWNNLLAWCKAARNDMVLLDHFKALQLIEGSQQVYAMVNIALQITAWWSRQPWEVCVANLQYVHMLASAFDPRW
ncbi:hypothetical protein LTR37_010112 [Vermiconidia calcicola]|uniref:Uncharacterized protein n=1 Tax=Vermiconidia calcicola TaxID=1690605 RepID=A0ACC3N6G3_9PEZI|nr:hypothetical protein LTR37_010112 [Vermiconidia calcicola]